MTKEKFQELTIWGENGERDLLLLVKNVMFRGTLLVAIFYNLKLEGTRLYFRVGATRVGQQISICHTYAYWRHSWHLG